MTNDKSLFDEWVGWAPVPPLGERRKARLSAGVQLRAPEQWVSRGSPADSGEQWD